MPSVNPQGGGAAPLFGAGAGPAPGGAPPQGANIQQMLAMLQAVQQLRGGSPQPTGPTGGGLGSLLAGKGGGAPPPPLGAVPPPTVGAGMGP